MQPMDLLHTEYTDRQGRLVLFRCTDCGYTCLSLGQLHAHIESHWGVLGRLRFHFTQWLSDDPAERWLDSTETVAVEKVEPIELDSVEGL